MLVVQPSSFSAVTQLRHVSHTKRESFGITGAGVLQAGCPSCYLTNSVKALKELKETNSIWQKSLIGLHAFWSTKGHLVKKMLLHLCQLPMLLIKHSA